MRKTGGFVAHGNQHPGLPGFLSRGVAAVNSQRRGFAQPMVSRCRKRTQQSWKDDGSAMTPLEVHSVRMLDANAIIENDGRRTRTRKEAFKDRPVSIPLRVAIS